MTNLVDITETPARTSAPKRTIAYPATPSAIDRGGLPWDDHQRAWILDLRERGLTAEAVAAALGRSVETIYAQYQLLGSRVFARRTWSVRPKSAAMTLSGSPASARAMARAASATLHVWRAKTREPSSWYCA